MPHTAASSARPTTAVAPPRRSSRLARRRTDRSLSRSETGSSPERASLTSADRPRPASRRTSTESANPRPSIEQIIFAQPESSGEKSRKVKRRGPPAADVLEPSPPPPQQVPDCSILVPFIIGLSVLLAAIGSFLFVLRPSGVVKPELRLEHAVPLLTHHVRTSATLLAQTQDLHAPQLDHVSVREMRDAAGFANMDALRSDLGTLSERLTEAKILALDFGVGIWMAGGTTHTELNHVLSSLTASPVPMSQRRLWLATEYAAGELTSLYTAATKTHSLLLSAHTLGITITTSPDWRTLDQSASSTRRISWLPQRPDYDTGLQASAKNTIKAVERCGVLVRVVAQAQREIESMLGNLREVITVDDERYPPGVHGAGQMRRMMEELREALGVLSTAVQRTQPNKT